MLRCFWPTTALKRTNSLQGPHPFLSPFRTLPVNIVSVSTSSRTMLISDTDPARSRVELESYLPWTAYHTQRSISVKPKRTTHPTKIALKNLFPYCLLPHFDFDFKSSLPSDALIDNNPQPLLPSAPAIFSR